MDETDLRAYVGLLILAGVYRSRGEAAASWWDAENGRAIFRATMPLKLFHTYSRLLRFDERETRRRRRATDKLAAVREVWDAWVARLIQVRIHAYRHSGVLHAKEKQERGAPEHTARRGRHQLRRRETGHCPGLQPQIRWSGQPRRSERIAAGG